MGKYRIDTDDGKSYEVETDDTPNPVTAPQKRDRLSEMVGNIPSSLKRTIMHPTFPGMPVGGQNINPGEEVGYTKEKFIKEDWPKIKNFASHPIDSVKDYITDNPVESALGVAALGRSTAPKTAAKVETVAGETLKSAAKEGTKMTPYRLMGHEFNLPAFLAGGAAGEIASLPFSGIPHIRGISAIGGASVPFIRGGIKGFKEGLTKAKNISAENLPVKPEKYVTTGIPPRIKTDVEIPTDVASGIPVKPLGQQPLETAVKAPNALPVQPMAQPGSQAPAKPSNAPQPVAYPEQKPIIPKLNETVKGTPEMPLVDEVIKPNSQPPGESLLAETPEEAILNKEMIAARIRAENAKNKYNDIIKYLKKEGVTKKQFAEMTPEERSARVKDILHEETTYHPKEHPTKSGQIDTIKGQKKYPKGFTESNLRNFLNFWIEEK